MVILLLGILLAMTSGCSSKELPTMAVQQYKQQSPEEVPPRVILSDMTKEIAGKVFYELQNKDLASTLAVTTAVPLADLKQDSEFGRLLAELLLTDLADQGLNVKELRLGKDIYIIPLMGEFIISRNTGELADQYPVIDYVIISTFTNSKSDLLVQGRLVDLKTGIIKTSWRYDLLLVKELLGLFRKPEEPLRVSIKELQQ